MAESPRSPDEAAAPGAEPRHLVVTVHGIRTYGNWQSDLKRLLEEAEPGIVVRNYQYGYFSAIAFLVPVLRWVVARRFREFLVHELRSTPPGSRIDLVAHSFGTYLAASALRSMPEGRRIHTVIFAGSVLRPSFPWYRYKQAGTLGRVVNDCGWDDTVLLLCQATALMMGMAGRVGFQGMVGGDFANRYHRGGHGLYFDKELRFMRARWVPLLTSDDPIVDVNERPRLTAWGGIKLFLMNNMQFIKVAGVSLAALALVLIPIDWLRKADFQKRVERFSHIAMLANAEQIPKRDPHHIRELLRVDVKASQDHDSDERSLDHLLSGDGAPDADGALPADDREPRWWEQLPGLGGSSRDAYLARLRHAQANAQLVATKPGQARDLFKARVLFEEAVHAYERVNDHDPANGSYALCLIDYGLLLTEMGQPEKAVEQFRKVRTGVFPIDDTGQRPTMPLSLAVDSFCYEAEARKQQERWEDAKACQLEAERLAKDDKPLLSYVCNEIAWLKMERLEVADAKEYFLKAKAACEELVNAGQFVFKRRLYHIRHGLAMTERLLGHPEDSYAQYDQIVRELKDLLQDDLLFSPKERRELRERLVNSMERRADVRFFARTPAADVARALEPARVASARGRELGEAEDDYQEVIEHVGQDDPISGVRIAYKKVITRRLAELASGPSAGDARPEVRRTSSREDEGPDGHAGRRPPLRPVDIEYATAGRAYEALSPDLRKGVKIYRDVASCLMALRHGPRVGARGGERSGARRTSGYDRKAVGDLRALTVEYARACETLKREGVEMLLIAFEALLEPGVEDDAGKSALDASRMMGVLGATIKVASHEELQPYLARFNRIASARLASDVSDESETPAPPGTSPLTSTTATPGPDQSPVLLYLRLSSTRALVITGAPASARPPGEAPIRITWSASETGGRPVRPGPR